MDSGNEVALSVASGSSTATSVFESAKLAKDFVEGHNLNPIFENNAGIIQTCPILVTLSVYIHYNIYIKSRTCIFAVCWYADIVYLKKNPMPGKELGFASARSGILVLANTVLGGSGLLGMPSALAKSGATWCKKLYICSCFRCEFKVVLISESFDMHLFSDK